MRKYHPNDVIQMIRAGKGPGTPEEWCDVLRTLKFMPSYMIIEEDIKKVAIDSEGNRFYHVYLYRPDMEAPDLHPEWSSKMERCFFDILLLEAEKYGIHILVSVTMDEPESLMIVHTTEFMCFVDVIEDLEAGTVVVL